MGFRLMYLDDLPNVLIFLFWYGILAIYGFRKSRRLSKQRLNGHEA